MIINTENIRTIRQVAANINDMTKIDPYINEVEMLWVLPAFGASLYKRIDDIILQDNRNAPIVTNENELITLPSPNDYESLLSGCYYDSDTKYSNGLIKAVAYLAYSKMLRNQNINVTAFGVVSKMGEFSEKTDEKTVIRSANEAEKIGLEYLNQCVLYLKYIGEIEGCTEIKLNIRKRFIAIGD